MHSKAATQAFTCTEIEATAGTNFWIDFRTVHTVLAQKSRAIQLSFMGTVFEVKGTNFKVLFFLQILYNKLRKGT